MVRTTGHAISLAILFCLLALRTFAQPGNPLDAAPQNPLDPTPADLLVGIFSDGNLAIELSADAGQYSGQIAFGGQTFPLRAQGSDHELRGTFESNGNSFDFTASLEGDTLTFVTGASTYTLQRQGVAPEQADTILPTPVQALGGDHRIYEGTLTTTFTSRSDPSNSQTFNFDGVEVRVEPPLQAGRQQEGNPFNLAVRNVEASENTKEGAILLHSAHRVSGSLEQCWTLTLNGDRFSGSVIKQDRWCGSIMAAWELVPGIPGGLAVPPVVWEHLFDNYTTLQGTIDDDQVLVRIEGIVGADRFVSEVVAERR